MPHKYEAFFYKSNWNYYAFPAAISSKQNQQHINLFGCCYRYDLYLANKLQNNKKITIDSTEAEVTGKCLIRKKITSQ